MRQVSWLDTDHTYGTKGTNERLRKEGDGHLSSQKLFRFSTVTIYFVKDCTATQIRSNQINFIEQSNM